jgi:uncharacterized protein
MEIVRKLVSSKLRGIDASHDYSHVERVEKLGVRIALVEGIDNDNELLIIRLACLLHDIEDYKYRDDNDDNAAFPIIRLILTEAGFNESSLQERVCNVIKNVSFHTEIKKSTTESRPLDLVSACVQDADRLDAIGAIGIARCFTYGGAKHRILYDPNQLPVKELDLLKNDYTKKERNATTINHFHEKLLLLAGMMKTKEGKRIAENRHQVMIDFLEEFQEEWLGNR